MRHRYLLLILISAILVLLVGCAQPNDPAKEVEEEEINYLEEVAFYETEGYVVDLDFGENYLYVAEDEGGFSIYNIESDTLCSRTRGYYSNDLYYTMSNIRLITVEETSKKILAYNKYGTNAGMHIFDISDPNIPYHLFHHAGNTGDVTDLTSTAIDTLQFQFYWSNDYEYYSGKCRKWEASEIWGIQGEVAVNLGFDVAQMDEDYDNGTIYCASKQLGMKIVNKTDFSTIGTISTLGQTIAVKVVDSLAYLGNREEGIQIIDFTDLENPVELFNYNTVGLASDISVDVEKNIFALASTSGGVYLFKGSNDEIERLQRIDDSEIGYTNVVAIKGDYLYVGTRYGIHKYLIVNL